MVGVTSFTTVRRVLRWEGWGGVITRAVKKALRPVIQVDRWFFFEADLTAPLPRLTARVPLEVRLANPEDWERFADEFHTVQVDREEARRRFERGDMAILGLSSGHLAHVQWVAFSSPIWLEDLGISLSLNTGEAYDYDVVTLPAWRGQGIQFAVLPFVTAYMRARGCDRFVYYVAADNVQSLKVPARLGRKKTRTVWSVRTLRGTRRRLFLGVRRGKSPSLTRGPVNGPAA